MMKSRETAIKDDPLLGSPKKIFKGETALPDVGVQLNQKLSVKNRLTSKQNIKNSPFPPSDVGKTMNPKS